MRAAATLFALWSFGHFIQPLLRAEEGGSGHYLPGAMASFVDGVPPAATFIARYNLVFCKGSIAASEPLPIAGLQTLRAEATSWAQGLRLLWRSPLDLGDRWSYALSTPYHTSPPARSAWRRSGSRSKRARAQSKLATPSPGPHLFHSGAASCPTNRIG
jgi:hypothetical protein